jgi:hypothetical protein
LANELLKKTAANPDYDPGFNKLIVYVLKMDSSQEPSIFLEFIPF